MVFHFEVFHLESAVTENSLELDFFMCWVSALSARRKAGWKPTSNGPVNSEVDSLFMPHLFCLKICRFC